jgi:hypothetical protein
VRALRRAAYAGLIVLLVLGVATEVLAAVALIRADIDLIQFLTYF